MALDHVTHIESERDKKHDFLAERNVQYGLQVIRLFVLCFCPVRCRTYCTSPVQYQLSHHVDVALRDERPRGRGVDDVAVVVEEDDGVAALVGDAAGDIRGDEGVDEEGAELK